MRTSALIQVPQQVYKTTHKIRDTDANGTVEQEIPGSQVPPGLVLLVERAVIFTNGAYAGALPEFFLYADDSDAQHLREYSPRGNRDVLDENSKLRFESNEAIIARWTGLDATVSGGATATISIQGVYVREIFEDIEVGAPRLERAFSGDEEPQDPDVVGSRDVARSRVLG